MTQQSFDDAINDLLHALRSSWSIDTSSEPSEWSTKNPARGQCVVSSLVVQDYLGGDLIRFDAVGPNINETHYCNLLEGGAILDSTASQYKQGVAQTMRPINLGEYDSARAKRLADPDTSKRYELLKSRVESVLQTRSVGV